MLAAFFLISSAHAETNAIDLTTAKRYFREAEWASKDEGAKLWGKTLYGPMMFVDSATGFAVANQADADGLLKEKDGVWVGALSQTVPFANTALEWSGTHWSMMIWNDIPSETSLRTELMMHESFHRIEESLGLEPLKNPNNDHLDTKDGRIWLRKELEALSQALVEKGVDRTGHLSDAIIFRAYRRMLFPRSGVDEDAMEMHEGMAEYTGMKCMGLGEEGARFYLAGRMKKNESKSYPRSFAYQTGPAYGLLLDQGDPNWRKNINSHFQLAEALAKLNQISLPPNIKLSALKHSENPEGQRIFREETAREQDRQIKEKNYRKLFITQSILILPAEKGINSTFDPNRVFPLGKEGVVYPTSKVSAEWGVLDTQKGVLMNDVQVFVTSPTSPDHLQGDGWKLQLNPGWKVIPCKRPGDFGVVQKNETCEVKTSATPDNNL